MKSESDHSSFPRGGDRGTASSTFKTFTTVQSSVSTEHANPPDPSLENPTQEEKFDWYAQGYPLMPVCYLNKRVPHGKKVLMFP
ncbi:hypothetical protein ACFXTO_009690 [Malus domestica]